MVVRVLVVCGSCGGSGGGYDVGACIISGGVGNGVRCGGDNSDG